MKKEKLTVLFCQIGTAITYLSLKWFPLPLPLSVAFMHGIDIDYIETVRQKYYRMRNAYNRKGMFLGSLTRKREDKTPVFVQHRTTANNTEQL